MDEIKEYLAKIGRKGGQKSKRVLTSEQAREMVRSRVNKRKNTKKLDNI